MKTFFKYALAVATGIFIGYCGSKAYDKMKKDENPAENAAQAVADVAETAKDKAAETVDAAKEKAAEVVDAAKEKAGDAAKHVADELKKE